MKTHFSPLTSISFPPYSQLDFLNLAFILRFNFKHEQTQIPTVSEYSSWGMFTLAFLFGSKALLVSQSPDCPTYHALVVIAEQSWTRLLSNDNKPKHALKISSLDKTRSTMKLPPRNTNTGDTRSSHLLYRSTPICAAPRQCKHHQRELL